MSDKSAIEWTEATWNPVTGCTKVSPGCAHCYIERTPAFRIQRRKFDRGHIPLILHEDRLEQPLRWRRPRLVFVNSLSDLFHEDIPDEFIWRVFDVMEHAHEHTFQVLTKRPERMRDFVTRRCDARGSWGDADVEQNIWLGVSIENRRYVDRADLLRQTPAAVRFISAEPLLGALVPDLADDPVEWTYDQWSDGYEGPGLDLIGIDWVIVGGESGPRHRPVDAQWIRDLRNACLNFRHVEGAGPAFFFKQWGGRTSKSGGRELDGRTWDEYPTAVLA